MGSEKIDIIVVGGGGREHAIIKKLRESPRAGTIYALPGNGGIEGDAICVPIKATDIDRVVSFAREHNIGFAVVAPDDPLVLGMADALREAGIPCFGPGKAAAQIEGSKVFAKNLMKKYGIPTADYRVYESADDAITYIRSKEAPIVIKADGLALGKGVTVAATREEAEEAVRKIMIDRAFGESGSRIVVEECLTGHEVSVLAFTDGKTIIPMVSSMDHKRALTGGLGPNTGGMGTIAPNPYYTKDIADVCMEKIFRPTILAMEKEGVPFTGCLYFGLMITPDGPKVIEYNCRFGDPEAQVVLPLLQSDLLEIMLSCERGTLDKTDVKFSDMSSCCVVLVSSGYPGKYETGFPIRIGDVKGSIYFAGVKRDGDDIVTSGGRVLGVTCVAKTLGDAIKAAYQDAEQIEFTGKYMRADIGAEALSALSLK